MNQVIRNLANVLRTSCNVQTAADSNADAVPRTEQVTVLHFSLFAQIAGGDTDAPRGGWFTAGTSAISL